MSLCQNFTQNSRGKDKCAICLSSDYNKIEAPFFNATPLNIKILTEGISVLELDDTKFTISLSMYLGVKWKDYRIKFCGSNPQLYQVYEMIDCYLLQHQIIILCLSKALDIRFIKHLWVPDIFIQNMRGINRIQRLQCFSKVKIIEILKKNLQDIFY